MPAIHDPLAVEVGVCIVLFVICAIVWLFTEQDR
jgi:hypothetical protein